jgi:hypothetical protein
MADWFFGHSNLVRRVAASVHRQEEGSTVVTGESTPAIGYRPRVPEEDRRAVLEMFRDFCAVRDIELVVVIPWYRKFDSHIPLLRRFAVENGLPVVDLPAILESIPQPIEFYFDDEVHPNARGHRQIAGAILGELANR